MTGSTLPFIDIHRHLDGNVRVSTIFSLAREHNLALGEYDIAELEKLVYIQDRTSDLLAFLQKLDYGVSVLTNTKACERIAFENVEDAFNEGLAYVELRFSPYYMAQTHQLPLEEVVAAVIRGVKRGEKAYPVKANLIGILSRTFGQTACMQELTSLLAHHKDIVGLDLAGDEFNYPAGMFVDHFDLAREKTQWRITIHAGEAQGSQSVWDAITLLHANRIGHGVRAIEDPKLMSYLADNAIGIESCITSNYQTGTWTDINSHPVKRFLQAGIKACLNTDDPGVSNISLSDEFLIAKNSVGLSEDMQLQLQRNAIDCAFLSEGEKQVLLSGAK